MIDATRGILYPARLPAFHRLPAPPEAAELVAWFWIPEWELDPGRSSRQEVVAYPALNLVVQLESDAVGRGRAAAVLSGATTRATHRDLSGRGWAVGALLRPAAALALASDPAGLVDADLPMDEPALVAAVGAAMATGEGRRERAVAAFSRHLVARVGAVDAAARDANAMADLIMGDSSVRSPAQAAARLSVSVRTLQRRAHRSVGLSPAVMIRRRRLQEAAQRVRDDPGADLATIAAEYGYADHAHLSNEFRAVLGFAPSRYRSDAQA